MYVDTHEVAGAIFLVESPPSLSGALLKLSKVVAQVALQVLFIVSSILITVSFFPIWSHALVLPPAALGASFLASFFHCSEKSACASPIKILEPTPLANEQNNCAFNALLQMVHSTPPLLDWCKDPLSRISSPEVFCSRLKEYAEFSEPLERWRQMFQEEGDALSLTESFSSILSPVQKRTFESLLIVQDTLFDFFKEYDERKNPDSQKVRTICSQLNELISPSSSRQEDAAEIWSLLTDVLPLRLKVLANTRYRLEGSQCDAFNEPSQTNPFQYLSIPIDGEEEEEEFSSLANQFCGKAEEGVCRARGVDGKEHNYQIVLSSVDFVDPLPPYLGFHLKRFYRNGDSLEKNHVKIEIPHFLKVPTFSKEIVTYHLSAAVLHKGESISSGHYTAICLKEGQWFEASDQSITQVNPEYLNSEQVQRQVYCLSYVRLV